MKNIAVIQHSPWEGPGRYLLEAAANIGLHLHIIKAWQADFPGLDKFTGFLLLGGGANVNEEGRYPFLIPEKAYIGKIIKADIPCLGICLGHQLLAHCLGAEIGANFCHSIGIGQAQLTHAGRSHPLFADIDKTFPTFKWHSQAILTPLPKALEILATSRECQVEAFSIKNRPHITGVQFDNHAAHPLDVAEWYRQDRAWLASIKTFSTPVGEMLTEIETVQDRIRDDLHRFLTAFAAFL